MKINDLEGFRYSITNLPNDGVSKFAGRSSAALTMAMTYEKLIQQQISQLRETCKQASVAQVERNHLTALRAFLRAVQKSETSPVGAELTDEFDLELSKHLQASGLAGRSQSDRKSLLTAWRKSFLSLNEAPDKRVKRERNSAFAPNEELNFFERALWEGLKEAKLAPKTAAKRAGISPSAIGRWTRGALPQAHTTGSLAKLEVTLGMKPGALMEAYNLATGKGQDAQKDAYRQRLAKQKRLKYGLLEADLTPVLQREWLALLEFKTARTISGLKRQNKARWDLVESQDTALPYSKLWCVGHQMCPTASATWTRLSRFFGFLRLSHEAGGYGLSNDEAQTLAWLAVPEAIDAFLKFQTKRSDGLIHGTQASFAATVISLTRPVYGYLAQSPKLQAKLPSSAINDRSWDEMCSRAVELAIDWKTDAVEKSRDPGAVIRFLLEMDEPAAPVFAAMRKLRRIGDRAKPGSAHEAVARRNELILGLLISNPLRCKNLMTLTYKSDNTGSVYKSSAGRWRIRIPGRMFKNKRRVGADVYDVPVASWLENILADYVQHFHPILQKKEGSDYLLLNQNGRMLRTLSMQVARLTKLHIPGCSGFRPHAFRHLVATDWLNKNPNDFLTVAELLNDTVAVVMKAYAHLKKDVAFSRYDEYMKGRLPAEMGA